MAAQISVGGTVLDRQTGKPIPGAAVTVTGTTNGVLTNDAGGFALTSPTAISRLTVKSLGYLDVEVPVTGGEPLRIRLTPSKTELPGMQIVATRTTPATTTLTESELQRASGVTLENSINIVPGVFMQSRTPFGGARITLRGYYPSVGNSANFNGLGYQVLLNDIPVTDASGSTVLDDIDFARLGRVEIIRGPSSSQYGSLIGGAVLFTTARPQPDRTGFTQQVEAGNYGLLRTTTSFETSGANSNAVIDYAHQDFDSFRPHSGSGKEYWHGTADVNIGENQTLSGYFSYNRSFEELAGEIDSTPFYNREPKSNDLYLANDSHIKLNTFVAGVSDQYRFAQHFTNRTTLFGSGRTSNQPFAHGYTDVNQTNVGGRSVFSFANQWGNMSLNGSLGGQVQLTSLTSNGVFIVPAPPNPQIPSAQENWAENGSAFTEWSLGLPAQVTVTAGASVNQNRFAIRNMLSSGQLTNTTTEVVKKFDAVFTPRVAVTKAFGAAGSIYATVGSGYTPPLLSQVVSNNGAVNTALKPERAVQYEVGAQGNLFSNRLTAQASVFDLENTDKLVSQTVNSVTSTINAGKQRNRGLEASLGLLVVDRPEQLFSRVRPWASWAYTDAKYIDFKSDANNSANTVDFSGNEVARVPKNMLSAGIDLGTRVGAYLTSTYQHVDKVPVTFDNSTYVRAYDVLGARIGYRRTVNRHWTLDAFAGADNLTNATFYSFLFVGPNITGLATPAEGGRGDGYIIPAPYKATTYTSLTLRYAF
jgi:iron complex outermembrane receptor protein